MTSCQNNGDGNDCTRFTEESSLETIALGLPADLFIPGLLSTALDFQQNYASLDLTSKVIEAVIRLDIDSDHKRQVLKRKVSVSSL